MSDEKTGHSEEHMWSVTASEDLRFPEVVYRDEQRAARDVLVYHVSINLADGKPWKIVSVGYAIEPEYGVSNQRIREQWDSWPLPERAQPVADWIAAHLPVGALSEPPTREEA